MSYEELTTVLCQIEAVLNSRPLCPLTEDATSPEALTPGHFLVRQALTMASDPSLAHLKENRMSRYQYCQNIVQKFWQRFNDEYLCTLHQRYKWKTDQEDAKPGQLVIIKEDNQPPGKWKLAIITQVHPGPDNKVRVATVRTATGEMQRPVAKLIPIYSDLFGQRGGVWLDLQDSKNSSSNDTA